MDAKRRANRRFASAPIRGWSFSCVKTNVVDEIDVRLIRTSVFSFDITPRNSY